jgi:hypothetical protein
MREELLLSVPHRQVVFTIPKMLRIFFKYKRRLLGDLCRAAVQALLKYLQATTGTELQPGIVAVIQTSGDRINFHVHLHLLVTEGGEDRAGTFHHLAEFRDSLLAEFFKSEVFAVLLGEELISEALVEKIAGWRHSGFSVHSKVRARTKKEAERVGKYMIRPLLSLERLSLDEREGQVCYRYGEGAEEVERMDYLEFIARVTSHIPDKRQVTVRYLGLCKALHKPNYAEFKNMLSYYGNTLIFNQLGSMILSIITGSPGMIKWNHSLDTARFSKRDLGASEALFLSFQDQPRHTYEWWPDSHAQAKGQ